MPEYGYYSYTQECNNGNVHIYLDENGKEVRCTEVRIEKSENVKEFFQDNIFREKVKFLRNEKSINYISSPSRHLHPLEKESFCFSKGNENMWRSSIITSSMAAITPFLIYVRRKLQRLKNTSRPFMGISLLLRALVETPTDYYKFILIGRKCLNYIENARFSSVSI